jgi:hypothetical protein
MAMPGIRNGLYTVETDMTDGGRGHATGVIVLTNGRIAGGDAHFYYTAPTRPLTANGAAS